MEEGFGGAVARLSSASAAERAAAESFLSRLRDPRALLALFLSASLPPPARLHAARLLRAAALCLAPSEAGPLLEALLAALAPALPPPLRREGFFVAACLAKRLGWSSPTCPLRLPFSTMLFCALLRENDYCKVIAVLFCGWLAK